MLARWGCSGVSGPIGKGLELFNQSEGLLIVQGLFFEGKYIEILGEVSKESAFVQSISGTKFLLEIVSLSHLKMTFILFVLTFLSSSIKIQSSNNFGRNKESTRFVECIKKYCPKIYHNFAQNGLFRPERFVLGV